MLVYACKLSIYNSLDLLYVSLTTRHIFILQKNIFLYI